MGEWFKKHLTNVATIVEKLNHAGWEGQGTLYTISYCKDFTKKEAEQELKKLGIKKENITLEAWEDEGEE
ncbi:MAG: hypothetical protein Q7R96_02835 [Nanoarchaeota archaeon]|nr:hypothetical protein [Nanoarchaeota archaeon]